jgi:hypothetical protein
VQEKLNERVEESAEEVLARLERFVETHRDQRVVASPTVAPRPVPAVDTLIPSRIRSREETPPRRRRFSSEVAPALITVTICSFVILLSEWFDPALAVVVAAALMLIGLVGLVRRVPLARAYTFGLVVAALLIRFS